jgi:hypothetical protein
MRARQRAGGRAGRCCGFFVPAAVRSPLSPLLHSALLCSALLCSAVASGQNARKADERTQGTGERKGTNAQERLLCQPRTEGGPCSWWWGLTSQLLAASSSITAPAPLIPTAMRGWTSTEKETDAIVRVARPLCVPVPQPSVLSLSLPVSPSDNRSFGSEQQQNHSVKHSVRSLDHARLLTSLRTARACIGTAHTVNTVRTHATTTPTDSRTAAVAAAASTATPLSAAAVPVLPVQSPASRLLPHLPPLLQPACLRSPAGRTWRRKNRTDCMARRPPEAARSALTTPHRDCAE